MAKPPDGNARPVLVGALHRAFTVRLPTAFYVGIFVPVGDVLPVRLS